MIPYITDGSGSGYASSTIDQASGENDGPSLPVIGAVVVAAYIAYNQVM